MTDKTDAIQRIIELHINAINSLKKSLKLLESKFSLFRSAKEKAEFKQLTTAIKNIENKIKAETEKFKQALEAEPAQTKSVEDNQSVQQEAQQHYGAMPNGNTSAHPSPQATNDTDNTPRDDYGFVPSRDTQKNAKLQYTQLPPDPTSRPLPDPTSRPLPDPTAIPLPDPTAIPMPDPTARPIPVPPKPDKNLKSISAAENMLRALLSEQKQNHEVIRLGGSTPAIAERQMKIHSDIVALKKQFEKQFGFPELPQKPTNTHLGSYHVQEGRAASQEFSDRLGEIRKDEKRDTPPEKEDPNFNPKY